MPIQKYDIYLKNQMLISILNLKYLQRQIAKKFSITCKMGFYLKFFYNKPTYTVKYEKNGLKTSSLIDSN